MTVRLKLTCQKLYSAVVNTVFVFFFTFSGIIVGQDFSSLSFFSPNNHRTSDTILSVRFQNLRLTLKMCECKGQALPHLFKEICPEYKPAFSVTLSFHLKYICHLILKEQLVKCECRFICVYEFVSVAKFIQLKTTGEG